MASQGPNSPSASANDASIGSEIWSSVGNIFTSNNSYAAVGVGIGVASNYLKATTFGFSIPTDATIDGITVSFESLSANNRGRFYSVRLYKADTITGDDKSTGAVISNSEGYVSFGGASDLWGTTWSASNINNTGFGAALSVQGGVSGSDTLYIDHVRITVYYTEASGGQAPRSMHQYRMRGS